MADKNCVVRKSKEGEVVMVVLPNKVASTSIRIALKKNNGHPLSLAPNGEPSILYETYINDFGLTEDQAQGKVAEVYSNRFLERFGDWIQDPSNSSQVKDSNGQPRIVWSGQLANGKFDGTYKGYEQNYIEDGYQRFSRSAFFVEDKYDALSYATALSIRDEKTFGMYKKFLPQGYHHEPVFLNIRNLQTVPDINYDTIIPMITESTENGVDGFDGKTTSAFGEKVNSWVISSGSQVLPLSEIGNNEFKAPNGNATNLTEKQWLQVRTESFKEWFGDFENDPQNSSKVLDENGEPLVVYHGTDLDFDQFNNEVLLENGEMQQLNFFAENEKYARRFAGPQVKGEKFKGNLIPVFLNIKDPETMLNGTDPSGVDSINTLTVSGLIELGVENDGFQGIDSGTQEKVWVTLSPNQQKSAILNSGEFSKNSDNIYDGVVIQNQTIPSKLYQELMMQPFITPEQALEAYKKIYTDEVGPWEDSEVSEC